MSEQVQAVNVGRAPVTSYALEAATVLASGKRVVLRARGRSISQAVDVAEFTRRRLVKDAVIEAIKTGTDILEDRPVSFMEITLAPNNTQLYQPPIEEKPATETESKGEEPKIPSKDEKSKKPKKTSPERTARKLLRGRA